MGQQGRGHPRGDDEAGTGGHGGVKLRAVEHCTGTDHGIRHRLGDQGDGVEGHRGAQGDLEHRDAAIQQRLGHRQGLLQVVDDHHGYQGGGGKHLGRGHFPVLHSSSSVKDGGAALGARYRATHHAEQFTAPPLLFQGEVDVGLGAAAQIGQAVEATAVGVHPQQIAIL